MAYKVVLSNKIEREMRKLPRNIVLRLWKTIENLQTEPRLGKALKGDLKGLYSIRMEKYRLLYRILELERVVSVEIIDKRSRVYDRYAK